MSVYRFTGHPFIDAGVAGMAALLETEGRHSQFTKPEEITRDDVEQAIEFLSGIYRAPVKSKDDSKPNASCVVLLREILPGSSWDQVKSVKADLHTSDPPWKKLVETQWNKFEEHIQKIITPHPMPDELCCAFLGSKAHLWADKSCIPMLGSADERPNGFPNLGFGLPVSKEAALAVLFSPLSILKPANAKGTGGANIIVHTPDWRFSVEMAKRRIRAIHSMRSSKSLADYYKSQAQRGTYSTTLKSILAVLEEEKPILNSVVLWSFNATNQAGKYNLLPVPEAVTSLLHLCLRNPSVRTELHEVSDSVAERMFHGLPIIGASCIQQGKGKQQHWRIKPGWHFQRLYAQEILKMKTPFINAIEHIANVVGQQEKIKERLFSNPHSVRIGELARFGVESSCIAILADNDRLWPDYLRAACIWIDSGETFLQEQTMSSEPEKRVAKIINMGERLCNCSIQDLKKRMYSLNRQSPADYRASWIEMINKKLATWEDFINFCPFDDAIRHPAYSETRLLRDYLVAYLCSKLAQKVNAAKDSTELDEEYSVVVDVDTINLEDE